LWGLRKAGILLEFRSKVEEKRWKRCREVRRCGHVLVAVLPKSDGCFSRKYAVPPEKHIETSRRKKN
jgi:hypothetical protein